MTVFDLFVYNIGEIRGHVAGLLFSWYADHVGPIHTFNSVWSDAFKLEEVIVNPCGLKHAC